MRGRKGLKMDTTVNKMRKINKDEALSDDTVDLIDKAKTHFLNSLQDIIVPLLRSEEKFTFPQMEMAFAEPTPTEGTITNLRSTLEMLFGEIKRDRVNFRVPEVFEGPNTKDTRKNIFNVRDSIDNNKDSFGKMLNNKDLIGNRFNQKDSVESMFNDDDSVGKYNHNDLFESKSNAKDSSPTLPIQKKSSVFPPESSEEDDSQESPCNCECSGRNHGGSIRKIIQEIGDRKLKISVRL